MLDLGEVIDQGKNNLIVQMQDARGKWWRGVIKQTQDGREVYLSTLHKITKLHRDRMLKRGEIVRSE